MLDSIVHLAEQKDLGTYHIVSQLRHLADEYKGGFYLELILELQRRRTLCSENIDSWSALVNDITDIYVHEVEAVLQCSIKEQPLELSSQHLGGLG